MISDSMNKQFNALELKILEKLNSRHHKQVYDADLLAISLTARSISIYHAMKDAHEKSNLYAFIILYRAQIETLATINFVIENKSRVKRVLYGGKGNTDNSKEKIPNILTLIDKCKKKYPKLRDIYENMSEMAHPNAASHFLSSRKDGNATNWTTKPVFSKEESEKALLSMKEICGYVINDLDLLIDNIMA